MTNYVKRVDIMKICEDYSQHCFNSNDARGQDIADRILDDVVSIPTADVVSTKAFEQVKWERDTAIEQLESYGVGFCENKELVEVVRCKNCVKAIKESEQWKGMDKYFCDRHHSFVLADDFCSYGERSDT